MTWGDKFDIVRHIFEFFFYLITGPLMAIFAFKKIKQGRDQKREMFELQKRLLEMAQSDKHFFKENIVPLVKNLDSKIQEEHETLVEETKFIDK
jgi:hypothetical protein